MTAHPAMIAFSVAKGMMEMQAAKAEARGYQAQAAQSLVESRARVLQHKQQGVAVLDNILKQQAAVVARAGAGNVDPFSGSAMNLMVRGMGEGIKEFKFTQDGATIAGGIGQAKADQYLLTASATVKNAFTKAAVGIAGAAYEVDTLGSANAAMKE